MKSSLRLLLAFGALFSFALPAAAQKVPSDAEAQQLIQVTLADFSAAVTSADFSAFHAKAASQLQDKYTAEKLKEAFAVFVDNKINVEPLVRGKSAVFEPAVNVDGDGVLTLQGTFSSTPKVKFRCRYVFQRGVWKSLGVNVEKEAAGKGTAVSPSDGEAQRLVFETMKEFSASALSGNFTLLHAKGSEPLRAQVTPEKLREAFAGFVDQKISVVAQMTSQTAEFEPFTIDDDGVLLIKGTYPGREGPIKFTLKYLFENGEWRWLALNVKT